MSDEKDYSLFLDNRSVNSSSKRGCHMFITPSLYFINNVNNKLIIVFHCYQNMSQMMNLSQEVRGRFIF